MPILATNKQAKFSYEILDTFEAGIVLEGHEVKSVKEGNISLKAAYVSLDAHNELWLKNAAISKYRLAGPLPGYDPERPRKLLLHKKEINSLVGKLQQQGLTIVPISVYTKHNKIKVEVALARGKKKFEKKESLKKKDIERDVQREIKR